jgi:hypothetical protein
MRNRRNPQLLSCRELTEQTNAFIDGELGFWPAMGMRMHLLACRHCRSFVRQMRTVLGLVQGRCDRPPPNEIGPELLEAFRKKSESGPHRCAKSTQGG